MGQSVMVGADLETRDLDAAAGWAIGVASDLPASVWTLRSSDGGWSARRTLDHLSDVMLLYAAYVATRARDRVGPPRNGDPRASVESLIEAVRSSAAILCRVLDGLHDDERAFHPSGLADRTGWIGVACTELLVHGYDIGIAGGLDPIGPDSLAGRVVERVLPWAPLEGNGWARLLWATGRRPLGARTAHSPDWWWHSAPLSEWDGDVHLRDAPPQW